MDLHLSDKVFMVAAASKGLGRAIAENLASEGAKLSLGSRRISVIKDTAETISNETGSTTIGYELDVSSLDSIQKWYQSTIRDFGRVDGLVINAGGPPTGSFESFDDENWQNAFDLTLMSAVRLIREVLPIMKEQKSGVILALTSSSIKEPIDGLLFSNVFRSGVNALVKTLSRELSEYGIRINNIVPGRIDTDRVKSLDSINANKSGITKDQQKNIQEKSIPLGRYGTPDEFGKAATFLLSDVASYVTGTSLIVDGGKIKSI